MYIDQKIKGQEDADRTSIELLFKMNYWPNKRLLYKNWPNVLICFAEFCIEA